jgi:hypothetical protein
VVLICGQFEKDSKPIIVGNMKFRFGFSFKLDSGLRKHYNTFIREEYAAVTLIEKEATRWKLPQRPTAERHPVDCRRNPWSSLLAMRD